MVVQLYRFVGQANRLPANHCHGQWFVGGKMEIRKKQLIFTNEVVLLADRFFDLDDHFSFFEIESEVV